MASKSSQGHALAGNKLDSLSANHAAVFESATSESYQSAAAMAKHETAESPSMQRKEIKTYKGKQ
jgi:hypothetical protein